MANRYLVAGAGGTKNWSDTSIWSDSDGGATGFSAPGINDKLIGNAASLSGALILTLDSAISVGEIDTSALDNNLTITGSVYTLSLYGSLTENATYSLYNLTGTSYIYFKGTGTITTNGRATHVWNRMYINGAGITVTNGDDITIPGQVQFVAGTWNTNGKNITISGGLNIAGNVILTLGSSVFKLLSSWVTNATSYTLNANTSTVWLVNAIGTFQPKSVIFYNLTIDGNVGVNALSNVYDSFTVSNTLTITGANATTQRVLIASSTIGTPRTITCNGTTNITNADFRDITLAGSANRDFSAQVNVGDCGGNSGITFPAAVPQYFKKHAATANYGDAANWFTDVALTVAGRVPLPQDDATFLAGSFNQTCTLTVNVPRIGRSLDMSAVTNSVTWTLANAIECYGSYVLGTNITPAGSMLITLIGRSTFSLNTFNKSMYRCEITTNGSYINLSNLTIQFVQVSRGTFDYNDFNFIGTIPIYVASTGVLYCGNGILESNRSTTGTVAFNQGTGAIVYPENATILLNPPAGAFDLTANLNGLTYNKIQLSGSHTGNFDITGSNTFAELIIDAGRKVRVTAGTTQNVAKVTKGAGVTLTSITAAQHTINYTGVPIVNWGNAAVSWSKVNQTNKFFVDTDGGNNTNWVIGAAFCNESAAVSDSLSSVLLKIAAIAEQGTVEDTLSALRYAIAAITEQGSVEDTLSATRFLTAVMQEATLVSDIFAAIKNINAAISEQSEISDTLESIKTLLATIEEISSVSDLTESIKNLFAAIEEGASASDELSALRYANAVINEQAFIRSVISSIIANPTIYPDTGRLIIRGFSPTVTGLITNNCQSDSVQLERIVRSSDNTLSELYLLLSNNLSRYFEALANCCIGRNNNLKSGKILLDQYVDENNQYEDIVNDIVDDIIDKYLEDAPQVVTQYAAAFYKEICIKDNTPNLPSVIEASFQAHICSLMEEPLPDYTYEATFGNFVCNYDVSEMFPYVYEAAFMSHKCSMIEGNYFYPEYEASFQDFTCELAPACETFSAIINDETAISGLSMTSEWLYYSCWLADMTFDLSFSDHSCIRNMNFEASYQNFVCIQQDWVFVASFIEFVCILIEEVVTTTTTEAPITTTTTTESLTTTTTTEEVTTTTTTSIPYANSKNGLLYNWYAVTDVRNIAPVGWHVPTQAELNTLITTIGGSSQAAKLMTDEIAYWDYLSGTNDYGFNLRGAGGRYVENESTGNFNRIKQYTSVWSSYNGAQPGLYMRILGVDYTAVLQYASFKYSGYSVRLLKDDSVDAGTMTGTDGLVYNTVTIGTQVWMAENYQTKKYRNGDDIGEEQDATNWKAAIIGRWCAYDNDEATYK